MRLETALVTLAGEFLTGFIFGVLLQHWIDRALWGEFKASETWATLPDADSDEQFATDRANQSRITETIDEPGK